MTPPRTPRTSEATTAESAAGRPLPAAQAAPGTDAAATWRSSFPAMGTRVDILGWGGDGMRIVNAVVALVARHEDLWSVFRPGSEVSRLNASGGVGAVSAAVVPAAQGCVRARPGSGEPPAEVRVRARGGPGLVVSEETDQLLGDALVFARATGGTFNPLIGPLVAAWGVKDMRAAYVAGTPLPPAPGEDLIRAALRACSPELLTRVGERRWCLRSPARPPESSARADAGAVPDGRARVLPSVDLGGIAKGYTADACRDLAVSMGARGVLVSVGTSSVAACGSRADGTPWRVGMRDPNGAPTDVCGVVGLPADGLASLSTSGDNLGPLGASGESDVCGATARLRDHHIIDPRTGYPARAGARQVSVVASSGVLAEALSTALLVDPGLDVDEAVARWAHARGVEASARVVGVGVARN